MTLSPGTRLGPYEILSPLGAGGMGEVYRARDTRLGRDVAVKVLPAEFAQDPKRLRRFEQEARAAAALNHPNILVLHDLGTHEGAPYIVTELLEGESLRQRLQGGPLPPAKAVEFGVQIAKGLAAAHEKGIVHRDLKPENLFVTKDGRIKILDFGLAKLLGCQAPVGAGGSVDSLTKDAPTEAGRVMGTVGYMSPEQVRGKAADARSDVFSFGVVLYEMLSGRRAFRGATTSDVLAAILTRDPEPLPSVTPVVLDRIVSRCLERRPEERFSSARDLAFALEASSGSRPLVAEPTPTSSRRRRALWLVPAGASVVLLALAGLAIWKLAGRGGARLPSLDPDRVLVVPFANQTGDPSLDPVGRLAASRIADGVGRTGAVRSAQMSQVAGVDAGTSASSQPLEAAAREAGAGLVIFGEYYLEGQSLRFESRLTYVGGEPSSCPFDSATAPRAAPSAAITAITLQAMGAFTLRALDQVLEPRLMSRVPTYEAAKECVAAYELFGGDYTRSIPHFQRAAELDPEFFFPVHQLTFAYLNTDDFVSADRVIQALEVRRQKLSALERRRLDEVVALRNGRLEEDRNAIRSGLELAPDSLWLHARLGGAALRTARPREAVTALTAPLPWGRILNANYPLYVHYFWWLTSALHHLGDHELELAEARRGVSVYPDLLVARACEVRALAALGRIDEVRPIVESSLGVNSRLGTPTDVMQEAAAELRAHDRREASLAVANRATEWLRTQPEVGQVGEANRAQLATFLCLAERFEEARGVVQVLAREHPSEVEYQGRLGVLAARRGDREEAERISNALKAAARVELYGSHTLWRARIAALTGHRSGAVELLRQSFAEGFLGVYQLHRDMDLEPLKGFEPYEDLVKPTG